jgi:hypothetical protein
VGTASQYIQLANTQKVELATDGEMQDFDFFAAQAIRMDSSMSNLPSNSSREDVFFYANQVLLGKETAGFSGTTLNPLTMDDSFMEFWDGGWRDWAVSGGSIKQDLVDGPTLTLPVGKKTIGFVAGTGGISIQGVTVDANGAALEVLTSGNLLVQAADFEKLSGAKETSFQAKGVVQMGATTQDLEAYTTSSGRENLAEEKQVRIERGSGSAAGVASSSGIAVVRSETGLEMRDVVIRGFSEVRLEKVSELNAPRVLVSGSSVRDFSVRDLKIKELVGALINADSKIQMAVLDSSGELGGKMVVQNGLPVEQKLAGLLNGGLPNELKNIRVDAETVSLAAKQLEFQNSSIAAMSAITARANTVLLSNSSFTVLAQRGMINFYTQQGLVNRTYGTEVEGQLNFISGVNSFRIGNNPLITVQDQATLNQHYGNSILDMNQNFGRPEAGKVNVLKM